MGDLHRIGDLEIDQDLDFQRRIWSFQRTGWVVMGVAALAALLGAFGGRGPVAYGRVGAEGDPLRLEYRRLARHGAPSQFRIHLGPGVAAPDSTVVVWLDRAWVDGLDMIEVVPDPVEARTGDVRTAYRFKLIDPARPATIDFTVEPRTSFSRPGHVGIEGGPSLSFPQFVFP